MPEQIRPDLSLFEVGKEDTVDTARQQPRQAVVAKMQRQWPQVLALHGEDVEGVKLHLVIVLAAVQTIEVGSAVDAEQYGLTIDYKRADAISEGGLGDERNRSLQSLPLRVNIFTRLPSR